MGNRKTFNDFLPQPNPQKTDYLIGFDKAESGGEKKFKLSDLRDYVHSVDVVKLTQSDILPIIDPNVSVDPADPDATSSIPFLSGKVFHIESGDHVLLQLPNIINSTGMKISCMVVNMTDHRRVEIKTEDGMNSLNARGVIPHTSGKSDATQVTFLKKRYDTGIFYFDGDTWFGYGDLDGPSALNIKNVYTDYVFKLEDEDRILHFQHDVDAGGVKVVLPDPSEIKSGTQFYIHNISNQWIEFEVPTEVNFHARAKFLRRKYDDAAVYTDGVDWFATGDLS